VIRGLVQLREGRERHAHSALDPRALERVRAASRRILDSLRERGEGDPFGTQPRSTLVLARVEEPRGHTSSEPRQEVGFGAQASDRLGLASFARGKALLVEGRAHFVR
jgi:hypothetical protein